MSDFVRLDVGGCQYTTTTSSLVRYPESMLGAMFSGRVPSARDDHGAYIIDGDGPIFRHVLSFLRRSKLALPEDFQDWDLLATEADYYQIKELEAAVKAVKAERTAKEMEFLEIIVKYKTDEDARFGEFDNLVYRGSDDTLQKVPILDSYFQPRMMRGDSITQRLKKPEDYFEAPRTHSLDLMQLFQQITRLGFKLSSSSRGDSREAWVFTRKIK
ncbi:BTB/POZ domain-containing protein KCTD6-like [Patiria miniata]|uniref:BTB domain-containing protein n=1 Tax=Patiria miniata TaxID=46514 RepID=A0A914BIV8_PATMI|nr:BTB/POZ domain-containing protein KCTD6-like [Patiria miniata]